MIRVELTIPEALRLMTLASRERHRLRTVMVDLLAQGMDPETSEAEILAGTIIECDRLYAKTEAAVYPPKKAQVAS